MDRSMNGVMGVRGGRVSKAGVLAATLALAAGTAGATDCAVLMVPASPVIPVGGSVAVNAFARFPISGFALASVQMDVHASAKSWVWGSSGVVGPLSVAGATWSQPHNPFGGPVADPSNPVRVWQGQFTPDSYAPALVTFTPDVSAFNYYPSPLTPSSASCTPREVRGQVLVNPLQIGGAQVAPGEGTSLEPIGPNALSVQSPEEQVLIGLLLPAVQKVREAASRMNDGNFTLTFNGQTTDPVAGDPVPTDSLSLNFAKIPSGGFNVQFDRPGAYLTEACAIGASGVWICLIENKPGGGFTVDRAPTSFGVEREMKESGEDRMVMTLEWDRPAVLTMGNQTGQVVRLRIASTTNQPAGLPAIQKVGGGFLTLNAQNAGFDLEVVPTCRADLTTSAVAGALGYGLPDGVLTNDDFFYYLAQFAAGNVAVADLTHTAVPGSPGYGVPCGIITNDDFFFYLSLFSQGC